MSYYLDQLLTREQRESCAIHDHPRMAEIIAQHRSGFLAAPEAAHAATEMSYEDEIDQLEGDPWIYWGIVLGVIAGMLLSL